MPIKSSVLIFFIIFFHIFLSELPLWTSKEANMLNGTGIILVQDFKKKEKLKFKIFPRFHDVPSVFEQTVYSLYLSTRCVPVYSFFFLFSQLISIEIVDYIFKI